MSKSEILKVALTVVVLAGIGLYVQFISDGKTGVSLEINKTMADVPGSTGK